MEKPNLPLPITVQLSGEDGNAFAIMGRVENAIVKAGYSVEVAQEYHEEATSGDYQNLLRVTGKWVEVL